MTEKVFAFMAKVENRLLTFVGINSGYIGYYKSAKEYNIQTSGIIEFDGYLECATPIIPLTDVPFNIYECRVIGFLFKDPSPEEVVDEAFNIIKQLEAQLFG